MLIKRLFVLHHHCLPCLASYAHLGQKQLLWPFLPPAGGILHLLVGWGLGCCLGFNFQQQKASPVLPLPPDRHLCRSCQGEMLPSILCASGVLLNTSQASKAVVIRNPVY